MRSHTPGCLLCSFIGLAEWAQREELLGLWGIKRRGWFCLLFTAMKSIIAPRWACDLWLVEDLHCVYERGTGSTQSHGAFVTMTYSQWCNMTLMGSGVSFFFLFLREGWCTGTFSLCRHVCHTGLISKTQRDCRCLPRYPFIYCRKWTLCAYFVCNVSNISINCKKEIYHSVTQYTQV